MESWIYFQFGHELRKAFSVCSAFLQVSHFIRGPYRAKTRKYVHKHVAETEVTGTGLVSLSPGKWQAMTDHFL